VKGKNDDIYALLYGGEVQMSAPAGRPAVVMGGQARFPEGRMDPGFYRGRFGPVRSSARLFARWP